MGTQDSDARNHDGRMKTGALGQTIPPFTAHGISVSLPLWEDNVAYEEGDKRVLDVMETGYPRFFIHKSIQKLASLCEEKFGVDEQCLLLPTYRIADYCRSFMLSRATIDPATSGIFSESTLLSCRIVQFDIPRCSTSSARSMSPSSDSSSDIFQSEQPLSLFMALFPPSAFPLAKQFWQHTGLGISSRFAERCLSLLSGIVAKPDGQPDTTGMEQTARPYPKKAHNRHYSARKSRPVYSPKSPSRSPPSSPSPPDERQESGPKDDEMTYIEERYGRNLPLSAAEVARRALQRRIAGELQRQPDPQVNSKQPNTNGGTHAIQSSHDVSEKDVFLFPCGMSAIWHAHQVVLATRPPARSVCWGFPYTDTLKILHKWGPGCDHFGHGLDDYISDFEVLLEEALHKPSILALFTEFPSNPLLRSANLVKLRALADKFDFPIVVDETIASFANIDVLPYADVVVSSLTKVFSGDANVMGGSLVLNPRSRYYEQFRDALNAVYEPQAFFDEDVVFLERNSRDFRRRMDIINRNTEAVCDAMLECKFNPDTPEDPENLKRVIKEVYFPKYTCRETYDICRIKTPSSSSEDENTAGFGPLFSLTFTSDLAARVFYDALPCHKGPSLGTNFTLASPYTILAHYAELDWAEGWGVESNLVRVSVGMEPMDELLNGFRAALSAAEEKCRGHLELF